MNEQASERPASARRLLPAAMPVMFAAVLAGCGHPAAPPGDAQAPGRPAAGPLTASGATKGRDDPLRTPVDGTLHYAIALTGDLHETGPHAGEKREAAIRRKVEVTTRMRAMLSNGPLAANNPEHPQRDKPVERPHTTLDDLARQADACNGNAACVMKISMKLANDPKAQKEIEAAGNEMVAMIGRTAILGQQGECKATVSIDDAHAEATFHEEWGEGYHNRGLTERRTTAQANATVDCSRSDAAMAPAMAQLSTPDGTRLFLDKQTGEYDITFAPALADAATTVDGKPGAAARIGTPKIALTGMSGAVIDQSVHGSRTLDLEPENGVPLRAEVTWTFTPGAP